MMSLSSDARVLARDYFEQKKDEILRNLNRKLKHAQFEVITRKNLTDVTPYYVEATEEIIKARVTTYIEAYTDEQIIPSEGDISSISWEVKKLIEEPKYTVPTGVLEMLKGVSNRMIESARRDLRIFIREMELGKRKKLATANPVSYNLNIQGSNYGGIQQGGQEHIQNNIQNAREFHRVSEHLIAVINSSSIHDEDKNTIVGEVKKVQTAYNQAVGLLEMKDEAE